MKLRVMFATVVLGCAGLNSVLAATLADENEEAAPGLYQKKLSAAFDTTSDPVSGGTVVPGALVASCAGSSYTYNGTTYSMAAYTTWAYKGYMHMAAQTTYYFVKNYDDSGLVRITSPANVTTEVLSDSTWGSITIKSYTAPEEGWYIIDLRVGNGSGGMGPVTAPFDSASQLGAGLAWNADGVTTCTTSNYGSWHKFMNTEEEPLFYTGIPDTADFTILPIPVQYMAGVSAEPSLVVSNKKTGAILQQGADKDYTVAYTNNTATGKGTAIVTGVNSYAGQSASKSFTVVAMSQDGYVQTDAAALLTICGNRLVYAFTNTVAALKLTALQTLTLEQALVVGGGKGTVLDFEPTAVLATDEEIELSVAAASENSSALTLGETTYTAAGGTSGTGKDSCITGALVKYGAALGPGTVILAFSVGDTSERSLQVEVPEYTAYFGSAVEPTVVVKSADGTVLTAGTDYTVTYINNTAPGTGAALVTGKAGTAAEGLTETLTFTITQVFFASKYGTTSATGTSWDDPMAPQTALTAASTADSAGTPAEVRFKSGVYTNTATLTATRPMVVRGGYLGADGTSDALDGTRPETVFSGNHTLGSGNIATLFSVTAAVAGRENFIERCAFGHARVHGFNKSGASTLQFVKCRFFNNGWNYSAQINGRGLYAVGTSASEMSFEDCEFTGNRETLNQLDPGWGYGAHMTTFKRVTMDNCLFATNAWCGGRASGGAAFYANNAPVTVRNCRFVSHYTWHPDGGGIIFLAGNGGGSAFTNCLFAGNATRWYGAFGNGGRSGAVCANFSTADQTVDFDRCTFAYNLSGSRMDVGGWGYYDYASAAALTVQKGAAKIRNSIFWGNSVSSLNTVGADVFLYNGSADIDHSLFGGLGAGYISASAGTALTLGDHLVVGDPCFVSTTNDVKSYIGANYRVPKSNIAENSLGYSSSGMAALCNLDFHVKSKAGYRTNGLAAGEFLTDTELYSPAIDASDLSEGVANEADPNGGIANLGYYGNTAEASKSLLGVPVLGAISLTFPDGHTCPEIAFTVGGNDVPFTGLATVYCGTGALAQAGTAYQWTRGYNDVKQGDSFDWYTSAGINPGEEVYVMVTLSSPGNPTLTNTVNLTATGALPPWNGHGGDPAKVVHVRAGSKAENPRGTSWTDAYPDVASANCGITETRNEIWVAGHLKFTTSPDIFTLKYPATIRGGFDGAEDSADERIDGAVATLDGSGVCVPFKFRSAYALTFERIRFTGGNTHAFEKIDSAGDVTYNGCEFMANVITSATDVSGAGAYFPYSSYSAVSTIRFNGCRFEGNGRAGSANSKTLYGGCVYISTHKALYVDGCTFVTNGVDFGVSTHGTSTSGTIGSCLYVNSTPTYITNCRFTGNRSSCYTTSIPGGTVYLTSKCGGSQIKNCAFLGNECVSRADTAANGGTMAGTIVVNLYETVRTLDIENCTFAWNLTSGLSSPVDVCAHVGTVGIKNSIFRGGVLGGATVAGVGKYCDARASGIISADYCMFDGEPGNCVSNYGGGTVTIGDHCSNDDPSFVTGDTFIANNVTVFEPEGVFAKYTPESSAGLIAADVHLVSSAGYYDNDGGFHSGGSVFSKAIDAGDPTSAFSNEPEPNGGFINLGAYGNTTNASMTVTVQPEILDGLVNVTFPDGISLPQVAFSLASSEVDYSAIATVYCGTGALAQAGTSYSVASPNLPIRPGEAFSWLSRTEPYLAGDTLYVKVVVTSGDKAVTNFVTVTVEGELPAWVGKGGGAGIVHVWADAPGDRNGSSWQHAFTSIADAVAAYDASISNLWIAGDQTLTNTLSITAVGPLAVRGGFDASENSAAERPEGTRSTIDALNSYDPFHFVNGAGCAVTLDRLVLINGRERAVTKTGAGDLTITACRLITNGVNAATGYGKGINVSSATGAKIVVTDTLFSGNRLVLASAGAFGHGCGAYITGCAGSVFERCDFIGNGLPLLKAEDGASSYNPQSGGSYGFALYSTVPVTARNCRFLANFGNINGGAVRLETGALGSAFTNCLFAANAERSIWDGGANKATTGGALMVNLTDAAGKVDVANCTFAYNLADGNGSASGLSVWKGDVTVKDSIFYGNILGERSLTRASDLIVKSGASCSVSYSLFTEDSTNSLDAVAGGILSIGDGVIYGDPLFVTPSDTVGSLVLTNRAYSINYIYFSTASSSYEILEGLNLHLRGKLGYRDETTGEIVAFPKATSPALDAGDRASDYKGEPQPNGHRVNLGYYGNTPYATMSPAKGIVLIFR